MRDRYTRYPRPVLWLVPGGELPGGREVEPFYLSQHPVNNEQFEAFASAAGRPFERASIAPEAADPAAGLSQEDARAYCRWYAEVARKPIRLPTEMEWEYACRGGTEGTTYLDPDDDPEDHVWHAGNSGGHGGRVPPVEGKTSNPFGLYGMLGFLWEWVEEEGVLRGGSFQTPVEELQIDLRRRAGREEKADHVGFRIARSFR